MVLRGRGEVVTEGVNTSLSCVMLRRSSGPKKRWRFGEDALQDAQVALAEVTLEENGLMVPQYIDSATICYHRSGRVGVSYPLQGEFRRKNIGRVRPGSVFSVPRGVVFWWYNEGTEPHRIFCAFQTSKALRRERAEHRSFHLAGAGDQRSPFGGVVHGFTRDVLSTAWNVDKETVESLLESQRDTFIVKAPKHIKFPETEEKEEVEEYYHYRHHHREEFSNNIDKLEDFATGPFLFDTEMADPDFFVRNGGWLRFINSNKFPVLRSVGLSAIRGKLQPEAMCVPYWSPNSHQIIRITRGEGRFQVVDNNGNRVLDTQVREDSVVVIPAFFPATKIAISGADEMEWITFLTSARPILSFLAGRNSVYEGIPEEVVPAAFDVDVETIRMTREREQGYEVIVLHGQHGGSKRRGGRGEHGRDGFEEETMLLASQ